MTRRTRRSTSSSNGAASRPTKQDKYNTYRAPVVKPSKKQVAAGAVAYELGQARPVEDAHALFESEYKQQYRSLPFWKRSVILVAGVVVNLLFAVLLFVVLFSLIGVDVQTSAGDIRHVNVNPLDAIRMGFMYIGMVVQLIAGLFNPWTAGEVVQNSTSVIGIAAMSKQAVDLGLASAISFVASISVSLGIMNLLPIPPLDGSSIFAFFLPQKYLPQYYKVQRYAMPVFLIVVLLVPYVLHFNPIGIYLDATAGNVFDLLFSFGR